MRLLLLFLLSSGVIFLSPSQVAASDSIWSGVVLVTNEPEAKPAPHSLERFVDVLGPVFGCNAFYLLGKTKKEIRTGDVEWFVPSEKIYMRVTVLDASETSYRMQVDLFENKDLLVTAEARLARNAPLFIRGPQWGNGQLVAILEVQ